MLSNPSSSPVKQVALHVAKPSIETPSVNFASGSSCSFTKCCKAALNPPYSANTARSSLPRASLIRSISSFTLSPPPASWAEGRRFKSCRVHHSTSLFSAPVCLFSHCGRRNRKETVRKPALVGRHRKGSRAVLVRLPVELWTAIPASC